MGEHETGQVVASAAEVYDEFFVPALFKDWPPHVLSAAGVTAGDKVLDVACGTGVLARAAADLVGPKGHVTGFDLNAEMLAVAQKSAQDVKWQQGPAEDMPFADGTFDCVVSQFGLMFFENRVAALQEMARVLKPGGRAAVAVWASLEVTPGYAAVARMLNDLYGAKVASSIEMPYALGNVDDLAALAAEAGLAGASIQTVPGLVRFPSLEQWLFTDIKGWTLADVIDDAGYAELQKKAPDYLGAFVQADGSVRFDGPAHILTFEKE